MRSKEEDRGPGARKTKLEKRLNANADLMGSQQGTPRGHKAQLAQPHRAGRPSGGNIRTRDR